MRDGLAAVRAGANQVQGTINGYGERVGNCNLTTIMPPLLMVLSVATVVHFTSEYALHSKTKPGLEAAEHTFAELLVPTFMCEATTAVGFVSWWVWLGKRLFPRVVRFFMQRKVWKFARRERKRPG